MIDTAPILAALNEELAKATSDTLLQLLGVARSLCTDIVKADIILRFRHNRFEDFPHGLSTGQHSLSPALQAALQAIPREGLGVPAGVGRPDPEGPSSPLPSRQEVSGGLGASGGPSGFEVPPHMADRQRPRPPSIPRPAVAGPEPIASLQVPLRPGMEPVNSAVPHSVAIDGRDLIRAYSPGMIPVHAEDGLLLGCMPAFGDSVEKVYTRHLQEMSVGALMLRTVVVPYNVGIDPFDIEGFQPAPGIQPGPLSTGPIGPGANRQNPDVGRAL